MSEFSTSFTNFDKQPQLDLSVAYVNSFALFQKIIKVLQLLLGSLFSKAGSPVRLINMLPSLQRYPEHQKMAILHEGFLHGFVLPSFTGSGCVVFDKLPSIFLHPDIVSVKLLKEVTEGRIAGTFSKLLFPHFRISPLGIIPKKEPNTFRLIHHLSYPIGLSLNDDIDPAYCSVQYSSFDDALLKI